MRGKLVRLVVIVAVAVACAPFPTRAENPPTAARAPVERLTTTLLEAMKNAETLGFEGRFEKLAGILPEVFDFQFMARLSAGRYWEKLNESERTRYVDHFARMSTATFAARFDGYSGQRFDVLEAHDGPRGAVFVPTKIVKPAGDPVSIDYLVRKVAHDWRIVDIYLAGKYSEVATKRAEYTSVVKNEGIEGLLKRLDAKIAELRADTQAQ